MQLSSSSSFRDIRGSQIYIRGPCASERHLAVNFCTQSEYFTTSNCGFNYNLLALVVSEIFCGSQIYIRGPCAARTSLSRKILTDPQVLAYTYITVKFQLRSSIKVPLTESSIYNRFFKRAPKWGFGGKVHPSLELRIFRHL